MKHVKIKLYKFLLLLFSSFQITERARKDAIIHNYIHLRKLRRNIKFMYNKSK